MATTSLLHLLIEGKPVDTNILSGSLALGRKLSRVTGVELELWSDVF